MDRAVFVGGFKGDIIRRIGLQCNCVNIDDAREAIDYVAANSKDVSVVIMSLRMKPMNGIEAMEEIHRIDPDMPVIISTHDTQVATVVEAMQRGAYNYMYEPHAEQELPYLVTRAFSFFHAVRENRRLQAAAKRRSDLARFAGVSAAAATIRNTIERVADSSLSVLGPS